MFETNWIPLTHAATALGSKDSSSITAMSDGTEFASVTTKQILRAALVDEGSSPS